MQAEHVLLHAICIWLGVPPWTERGACRGNNQQKKAKKTSKTLGKINDMDGKSSEIMR